MPACHAGVCRHAGGWRRAGGRQPQPQRGQGGTHLAGGGHDVPFQACQHLQLELAQQAGGDACRGWEWRVVGREGWLGWGVGRAGHWRETAGGGGGRPRRGGGWWCLSTRQRWAVEGWCGSGAAAGDAPAMTNGLPGPWVHTYLFASPPSQLTTPRGAPGRTHPPVRPYRPPTKPTSDACHDVGVRGIGAVGLKFERHPEAGGQQGLDVH
mgnify:CR=1 FL=1